MGKFIIPGNSKMKFEDLIRISVKRHFKDELKNYSKVEILEEDELEEQDKKISKQERFCRKKFSLGTWKDFILRMNAIEAAAKGEFFKMKK